MLPPELRGGSGFGGGNNFESGSAPSFSGNPNFGGGSAGSFSSSVFPGSGVSGASQGTNANSSCSSQFSTSFRGFSFPSSVQPSLDQTSPQLGASGAPHGACRTSFGTSTQPAFNFGTGPSFSQTPAVNNQYGGSRVAPYCCTSEDGYSASARLTSLSGMPVYHGKSHEELRFEDYQLGNKCAGTSAYSGPFSLSGSALTSMPTPLSSFGTSGNSSFGFFPTSTPAPASSTENNKEQTPGSLWASSTFAFNNSNQHNHPQSHPFGPSSGVGSSGHDWFAKPHLGSTHANQQKSNPFGPSSFAFPSNQPFRFSDPMPSFPSQSAGPSSSLFQDHSGSGVCCRCKCNNPNTSAQTSAVSTPAHSSGAPQYGFMPAYAPLIPAYMNILPAQPAGQQPGPAVMSFPVYMPSVYLVTPANFAFHMPVSGNFTTARPDEQKGTPSTSFFDSASHGPTFPSTPSGQVGPLPLFGTGHSGPVGNPAKPPLGKFFWSGSGCASQGSFGHSKLPRDVASSPLFGSCRSGPVTDPAKFSLLPYPQSSPSFGTCQSGPVTDPAKFSLLPYPQSSPFDRLNQFEDVGANTTLLSPSGTTASTSGLDHAKEKASNSSTSQANTSAPPNKPLFTLPIQAKDNDDGSLPKPLELIVEKLNFNPWKERGCPKGMIVSCEGAQEDDNIIALAEFAVEQHNIVDKEQQGKLKYGRVLGACLEPVSGGRYHIALEAYVLGNLFGNTKKIYAVVSLRGTDRQSHLTVLEEFVVEKS